MSQLLVDRGKGRELCSGSKGRVEEEEQAGRDRMLYKLYDFYLRASFELEPNKMTERRQKRRACWLMEIGG